MELQLGCTCRSWVATKKNTFRCYTLTTVREACTTWVYAKTCPPCWPVFCYVALYAAVHGNAYGVCTIKSPRGIPSLNPQYPCSIKDVCVPIRGKSAMNSGNTWGLALQACNKMASAFTGTLLWACMHYKKHTSTFFGNGFQVCTGT